ncbi:hypothetical protein PFZ79_002665, partial [Enterococcus hirae]|nr:hypothetical protein [Enterococcus hirae]
MKKDYKELVIVALLALTSNQFFVPATIIYATTMSMSSQAEIMANPTKPAVFPVKQLKINNQGLIYQPGKNQLVSSEGGTLKGEVTEEQVQSSGEGKGEKISFELLASSTSDKVEEAMGWSTTNPDNQTFLSRLLKNSPGTFDYELPLDQLPQPNWGKEMKDWKVKGPAYLRLSIESLETGEKVVSNSIPFCIQASKVTLSMDKLYAATKEQMLQGTGDANTKVFLKTPTGQVISEGETDSEGKFKLTVNHLLNVGEKLEVVAQNDTGKESVSEPVSVSVEAVPKPSSSTSSSMPASSPSSKGALKEKTSSSQSAKAQQEERGGKGEKASSSTLKPEKQEQSGGERSSGSTKESTEPSAKTMPNQGEEKERKPVSLPFQLPNLMANSSTSFLNPASFGTTNGGIYNDMILADGFDQLWLWGNETHALDVETPNMGLSPKTDVGVDGQFWITYDMANNKWIANQLGNGQYDVSGWYISGRTKIPPVPGTEKQQYQAVCTALWFNWGGQLANEQGGFVLDHPNPDMGGGGWTGLKGNQYIGSPSYHTKSWAVPFFDESLRPYSQQISNFLRSNKGDLEVGVGLEALNLPQNKYYGFVGAPEPFNIKADPVWDVNISEGVTPVVSGKGDAGADVEIQCNGSTYNTIVDSNGTFSQPLSNLTTNGSYAVNIWEMFPQENQPWSDSVSGTAIRSTKAPKVSVKTDDASLQTMLSNQTITGTGQAGDTVTIKDGIQTFMVGVPSDGNFSVTVPFLQFGDTVTITQSNIGKYVTSSDPVEVTFKSTTNSLSLMKQPKYVVMDPNGKTPTFVDENGKSPEISGTWSNRLTSDLQEFAVEVGLKNNPTQNWQWYADIQDSNLLKNQNIFNHFANLSLLSALNNLQGIGASHKLTSLSVNQQYVLFGAIANSSGTWTYSAHQAIPFYIKAPKVSVKTDEA